MIAGEIRLKLYSRLKAFLLDTLYLLSAEHIRSSWFGIEKVEVCIWLVCIHEYHFAFLLLITILIDKRLWVFVLIDVPLQQGQLSPWLR